MELNIKYNSIYKELTVSDGGAYIESGLMDKEEQTDMAVALLNAVHDLLPDGFDKHKERINAMTELLCFNLDEE